MSLDESALRRLFESSGALLEGHFLLSSGLHSNRYLQAARVLEDPVRAEHLGAALAEEVRTLGAEVVLAPAIGGIVAGHEVARGLGLRMVFCEKLPDGAFALRRGFELAAGERVLVVEDVLTTRGSASRAAVLADTLGAEVVGVAALVDRGPGGSPLPAEPHVLWRLEVETWEPEACPLCRDGAPPPVKPGSRAASA